MFRDLLTLYMLFLRIGAVTFGGGMTMLPILQREIVRNFKWMDEEDILDYYALSQGLPGIIAVNVAVFVGCRRCRAVGGVAAALGMVTPSLVAISIIAFCLSNFQDNVYVQHALAGISVCVAALILDAVIGMWKKGVKDTFGIVLCIAMLALNLFTKLSPVLLVVACALLGVAAKWREKRKGEAE